MYLYWQVVTAASAQYLLTQLKKISLSMSFSGKSLISRLKIKRRHPSNYTILPLLLLALLPCYTLASSPHNNWDLGLGVTAYRIPDYNGSNHFTRILSPFPYIAYRGQFVKFSNGKITGTLFSSEHWFLNVSADGSPPINSDDNTARAEMPDLDPVIEVGPALEYYFFKRGSSQPNIYLDIPFRAGIATDLSSAHSIGWLSNPRIKYELHAGQWKLRFGAGPTYATHNFYDYYYGVKLRYETTHRERYAPRSGYGGMRYSFGFSRPINQFRLGGYFRIIDLSGASFRSSPLIETKRSVLAGLTFAWIIY